MKNRILSVLLVVAMLASMVVMPVYANGSTGTTTDWSTVDCPCGCGKKVDWVLENGEWTAWDFGAADKKSVATAGHYYIDAETHSMDNAATIDSNVLLDLRGNTLKRSDSQAGTVITVAADKNLTMIDSVGGGVIAGQNITVQVNSKAHFNAYNCTIKSIATAASTNQSHGTIVGSSNTSTTINLTNCDVIASEYARVRGSAINGSSTAITLTNCTVIGGPVEQGESTATGAGRGGAIWIHTGSLTLNGGTVEGEIYKSHASGDVTVTGAPTISNLDLTIGETVNLDGVTGGSIGVTAQIGTAITSDNAPAVAVAAVKHAVLGTGAANKAAGGLALICPHCDSADVTWTLRDNTGTSPAPTSGVGHYYLAADMERTKAWTVGDTMSICLDLRGNNLTRPEYKQVMSIGEGATLGLLDTVGGGEIAGGANAIFINKNATLKAYNCIFKNTTVTNSSNAGYATIACTTSGTATVYMKDCTVKAASATFVRGSAILAYKSTITLQDCKIEGGTVAAQNQKSAGAGGGGAIWVASGSVTINGGSITGGTAEKGDAIYVSDAGTLNLNGCKVDNEILVENTNATVTVSGKPDIGNLYLTSGAVVNASGLTGGTVKVTADQDTAFTTSFGTKDDAEAKASYFAAADAESGLVPTATDEGTLMLSVAATPDPGPGPDPELETKTFYCPHCEDEVTFVEWTRTTNNDVAVTEGHYYLKDAATIDTVEINSEVVVNLNGSNITRIDAIAFDVLDNATFVLFDSTNNKATVAGGTQTVRVNAGATFKAYDCTLTNNRTADSTDQNYTVVGCPSTSAAKEVYLEDCVITASAAKVDRGAALRTMSTPVTLKDCTVNGGKVSGNGAAIYVNNGTLTIDGGTVNNGTADTAGNGIWINGAGTVNVKGGATVGDINVGNAKAKINVDGKVTIRNVNLIESEEATINAKITVTNLDAASSIGVTAIADANILANNSLAYANAVTVAKAFKTVGTTDLKVALQNNMLQLTATPAYELVDGDTSVYFKNRTAVDNVYNGTYNTPEKMESAYLRILNVTSLILRYPAVLDVNGKTFALTVETDSTIDGNQGFNVFLFDSANADYATFGRVTINAAEATVNNGAVAYNAPDGNTYCAVNNEGEYSFHRLDMKITAVSLRTAEFVWNDITSYGGMYFHATYSCDDILKAAVKSYGVKITVNGKTEPFVVSSPTLEPNEELPIGMVTGIIKGEDTDAGYAAAAVQAVPYVKIDDKEVVGDRNIEISFKGLCEKVADMIDDANTSEATKEAYTGYMENLFNNVWSSNGTRWMYEAWKNDAKLGKFFAA